MTQWLKLAQDRRNKSEEDPEGSITNIPEKEFLLIHSQSIKTSNMHLVRSGGDLDPNIEKWIGNGHLVIIDYDSLHGNKPRFKLQRQPWMHLIPSAASDAISTDGWKAYLPLSVVDA